MEDFARKPETKDIVDLEDMRAKVSKRIEMARNNPINKHRLDDLHKSGDSLIEKFIEKGKEDTEDVVLARAIEEELMRSTAIADNIIEFREMLEQLSHEYGFRNSVWHLLAHENAHANVSETTGHTWRGYGVIFMESGNRGGTSLQPCVFVESKNTWGPREVITKLIEAIEAPEKYGDILSESDKANLEKNRRRLQEIERREAGQD